MYQIAVCICNIKVSSVRMSGWPVTQMAESPHLQAWHDRVPLLQVSPCVANQNMTSYETDNDMYIQDITGFSEKCTLCIFFVAFVIYKFEFILMLWFNVTV